MEARSRVVERVDGGLGVEVQIAPAVDALEQVAEEAGDVAYPQGRGIVVRHDEEILG